MLPLKRGAVTPLGKGMSVSVYTYCVCVQFCPSACWKVGVDVIDCRESTKCFRGLQNERKGNDSGGCWSSCRRRVVGRRFSNVTVFKPISSSSLMSIKFEQRYLEERL